MNARAEKKRSEEWRWIKSGGMERKKKKETKEKRSEKGDIKKGRREIAECLQCLHDGFPTGNTTLQSGHHNKSLESGERACILDS